MKRLSIIAALSIFLLSYVASACALSFHFAPMTIKVEARPGQIVNRSFQLTLKEGQKGVHFQAKVEDWWRSADRRQTFYRPPGTLAQSCGPWCHLAPVELAVSEGETLTIRVTIAVPEEARPGGYWAALTVNELPDPLEPRPEGIAVRFYASVSVGIYVEIPPVTRSARILGLHCDGERIWTKIENTGNTYLPVRGHLEYLRPGEEEPLAESPISPDVSLPAPVNPAGYWSTLPSAEELPDGTYLVRSILDFGLDHYVGAQKQITIKRPELMSEKAK